MEEEEIDGVFKGSFYPKETGCEVGKARDVGFFDVCYCCLGPK